MKRFLAVCLSALMILAFVPVAALPATAVDGNVAYLGSTTGDDSDAVLGDSTKPFKTIVAAINALGVEGGTVRFVENYDYTSSAKANVHYGLVTIDGGGHEMGINLTSNCYFKCTGPTYFKNIVFTPKQTADATKQFKFFGNYWPLTMGEGVSCTETVSGVAPSFSVIGGTLNTWVGLDTCVTVKSGTWYAVCAGTRGGGTKDENDNIIYPSHVANGHLQLFFEGGETKFLFAGNWDELANVLDYGGYCTCYISGGTVTNNVRMGGNNKNQQAATSLLVYTGGILNPANANYGIENAYVEGNTYIIYGGSVSKLSGAACESKGLQSGADKRYSDLFRDDGGPKSVDFTTRSKISTNIMPLRTASDTTVYVDYANGSLYGAGTEADPVKTLTAAYGMLTYTGGEIILMSDYKLEGEETDRFWQFYEPYHAAKIVINGEYNSVKHKITGDKKSSESKNVNSNTYTVDEGFISWVLNGDTEFKNIEFCNNRHRYIQANYHALTIGDGVDITTEGDYSNSLMTICGARYVFYEQNSYATDFDFCYQIFRDTDTDLSVLSGTFNIYPFSYYIVKQNKESTVSHSGAANVTVGGSAYIKNLYTYDYTCTDVSPKIYNYAPDVEVTIRNTNVSDKPYIESLAFKTHISRTFSNSHDLTKKVYSTAYEGKVINIHADNPDVAAGKYGIRIGLDNIEVARNCYEAWDLSGAYDEPVELRLESITKEGVSLRDNGDGTYSMRSLHNIKVARCVDMANFPVVEFGVLIMRSDNENTMTYIRGADAFSELPSLYGEDTGGNNYSSTRKIGKSIAFIRNADYSSGRVNNYNYDGTSITASFYGVVSGIGLANKDMQLSFRPYAVYADTSDPSNIKYMTFYGLLANASLLDIANEIIADATASDADKAIAQAIIDG